MSSLHPDREQNETKRRRLQKDDIGSEDHKPPARQLAPASLSPSTDNSTSFELLREKALQDTLPLIFSFLPYLDLVQSISLVSNRWHRACQDDSVWKINLKALLHTPSAREFCTRPPSYLAPTHFQPWKQNKVDPAEYMPQNDENGNDGGSTNDTNSDNNNTNNTNYRLAFQRAYRRLVLCGGTFDIKGVPLPPICPESQASLDQFQTNAGFRLPRNLYLLLRRRKVYGHLYHMWTANLDLDNLQHTFFGDNHILMTIFEDEQGCGADFVLFDKRHPEPDAPVYSLSNETFSWHNVQQIPTGSELYRNFERELVLQNNRLSIFLEAYAKDTLGVDVGSYSSESSVHEENDENSANNSDDEDSEQQHPGYIDFGIRAIGRQGSSSSEGEAEWDG